MAQNATKLIAVLLLLLLVSGCATSKSITTRFAPGPELDRKKPIKVFKIDEQVPENYEIIGVVTATVETPMKRASYLEEERLRALREDASSMGADAIVGYYTNRLIANDKAEVYYWSSALAARVRSDGQSAINPTTGYMVAIPKGVVGKVFQDTERAELLDEVSRRCTQYVLAQKGYYAIPVEEPTPDPVLEGFQAMDDTQLSKYGGPQTEYVLGTRFLAKSYSTAVVVSSEGIAIESTLYSKSQKKRIWQGTGIAASATGWILSIANSMFGDLRMQDAVRFAVFESLKGVPNISTNSRKK